MAGLQGLPGPLTPVHQTVLAKTGSTVQPVAVLSGLSLVLGTLLLLGSSRSAAAAGAGGAGTPSGAVRLERWGPTEIGNALWAALAAVVVSLGNLFTRRRRPKDRGRTD